MHPPCVYPRHDSGLARPDLPLAWLRGRFHSLHRRGAALFRKQTYSLVLIDVEGAGRVPQAEQLCAEIRDEHPGQKVGFVYNYRVAIESDRPDEIIRAEFNPEVL